ncbi:MAG: hypothetical protein ABL994_20740, partial [Verrucomicrobiales bacterium]
MKTNTPKVGWGGWSPSATRAALLCAGCLLVSNLAEAQYGYTGPSSSVEPYYKPSPQATAKGY